MSYVNQGVTESSFDITLSQESNYIPESNKTYNGSNEFILTDNDEKSTIGHVHEISHWCKAKMKKYFKKKNVYKRIPILSWLPNYNTDDAFGDLVAGITVGLTVIPQSIAYASIAGLPLENGLYGSFLGCFVYIILGSCKDVPIGPSAMSSLLTFQAARGVWQRAVLLTFLSGIIELLLGIFQFGFLIDFVSGPVSSGFTSAVALIIISSQVKQLFGIIADGSTFIEMWSSIFKNISTFKIYDTILGISCILILLLMRLMTILKVGPKNENEKSIGQKIFNKMLWLIGTSRNAIVITLCSVMAGLLENLGKNQFSLIGAIPAGLPKFSSPPFSISERQFNETFILHEESFSEIITSMGSGLIVIPLIALMEDIAICKTFANGKAVDATQELIAVGASNIANSFVQAYPGTGALARAAVNNGSGVRTPLGGLYTGVLVIVALIYLTPWFYFIPKAALAALIIAAVLFMIEIHVIKPIWRSKKTDLIPGLATFILCLAFPVEWGILAGIGLNILFILYNVARPKINIEINTTSDGTKYLMLTPDRSLIFPSTAYVCHLVNKQGLQENIPVVIECSHIYSADYTAAILIKSLIRDFNDRNQKILFYNLKPKIEIILDGVKMELKVFYTLEALEQEILKNI